MRIYIYADGLVLKHLYRHDDTCPHAYKPAEEEGAGTACGSGAATKTGERGWIDATGRGIGPGQPPAPATGCPYGVCTNEYGTCWTVSNIKQRIWSCEHNIAC